MAVDMVGVPMHGTDLSAENVVSFIPEESKKKHVNRRRSFIKVSYDCGSDADNESDEDGISSEDAAVSTKQRKRLSPRKRRKKDDTVDGSIGSEDVANDLEEAKMDEVEPRIPGAGWADVMAKILGKDTPDDEATVVLAKSKEYEKAKKQEKAERKERKKVTTKREEWENLGRVKPSIMDGETEKRLLRIATRGVVQLFNAVKKQKKRFQDNSETSKSQSKRIEVESAASKRGDFLDLLTGIPVPIKKSRNQPGKDAPGTKKPWNVLKDDFMMGGTMKDWDKQSSSGSQENSDDQSILSESE